jgi:hypothetical protein
VLYCFYAVLYCRCTMLYGVGTWLNYGASFLVIIYACTLYAYDVLSLIRSMVLQYLSSWPTDMQKFQYEPLGIVWYFYIIGQ